MCREGGGQKRGGVGAEYGLCRHKRRKCLIESNLVLYILGDGLDDDVGVGGSLGHIQFELYG